MQAWLITALYTIILAAFYQMVPTVGLAPEGKIALCLFLWTVGLWIIRPIPELISAIIGITLLLAMNFKPAVVLSGFASPVWWMVVFACTLGVAINHTGLGKRLAYYLLCRANTLLKVIFATTFANNLLAPFTPSNTARGAIMFGVTEGICESLGFEKGKRQGDDALMLANMYINTTNTNMFLTAMGGNAIAVSLIAQGVGKTITWSEWFVAAFVPGIAVLVILPYLVYKMFEPKEKVCIDCSYSQAKLAEMGPMSKEEKTTLWIMLITLVIWATEIWHKVPSTTVSFAMAVALIFPTYGSVKWADVEKALPWSMLLWLGFAMGLADTVSNTGGIKWLVGTVFAGSPLLVGISFTGFLLVLLLVVVFSHILFSGMNAMMLVLVPAAIQLAKLKGFDPFATGFITALAIGTAAFFLPFNSAPNLIFYSSGRYTLKQQLLGAIPLSLVIIGSLLFALFVWWPMIGLIK